MTPFIKHLLYIYATFWRCTLSSLHGSLFPCSFPFRFWHSDLNFSDGLPVGDRRALRFAGTPNCNTSDRDLNYRSEQFRCDSHCPIQQSERESSRASLSESSQIGTINLQNGYRHQTFFYYGNGWYPQKEMKNGIRGGFIKDEAFSKDGSAEHLSNNILTYKLVLQQSGNFSTSRSNENEIF